MSGYHIGRRQFADVDRIRKRGQKCCAHREQRSQRRVEPRVNERRIQVNERLPRRRQSALRVLEISRCRQLRRAGRAVFYRRFDRSAVRPDHEHPVRQSNRRRKGKQRQPRAAGIIMRALLFAMGPLHVVGARGRDRRDDLVSSRLILHRHRCDERWPLRIYGPAAH